MQENTEFFLIESDSFPLKFVGHFQQCSLGLLSDGNLDFSPHLQHSMTNFQHWLGTMQVSDPDALLNIK